MTKKPQISLAFHNKPLCLTHVLCQVLQASSAHPGTKGWRGHHSWGHASIRGRKARGRNWTTKSVPTRGILLSPWLPLVRAQGKPDPGGAGCPLRGAAGHVAMGGDGWLYHPLTGDRANGGGNNPIFHTCSFTSLSILYTQEFMKVSVSRIYHHFSFS